MLYKTWKKKRVQVLCVACFFHCLFFYTSNRLICRRAFLNSHHVGERGVWAPTSAKNILFWVISTKIMWPIVVVSFIYSILFYTAWFWKSYLLSVNLVYLSTRHDPVCRPLWTPSHHIKFCFVLLCSLWQYRHKLCQIINKCLNSHCHLQYL